MTGPATGPGHDAAHGATAGGAGAAATRYVRDRFTWFAYGLFAVYGFFLYAFAPAVPLLRDEHGTTRAVSGLHGVAFALGIVGSGLVTARACARWGRGRVLAVAVGGLLVSVVGFLAGPGAWATVPALAAAGLCGGGVLNVAVASVAAHHGPAGPTALTEANAVGAWIGLAAPPLLGALLDAGLGWRAGMALIVPLAAFVWFGLGGRRATALVPDGREEPARHAEAPGARFRRSFHVAVGVAFCAISTEFCLTLWGSDLIRENTGLSAAAATSALGLLVAGLAAGRTVGAPLARRWSAAALLVASTGVALAGFLALWLGRSPQLVLAGLLVLGLGLSVQYPLGSARAIALSGGRPDAAAARLAVVGGAAIGAAPFALGWLGDAVGVRWAFLAVPLLLAGVAAGTAVTARAEQRWP